MRRLQQIEERYLGGQSLAEFHATGGDIGEYARQVFAGVIFGPDVDPAAPELGIETADDLADALRALHGLAATLSTKL